MKRIFTLALLTFAFGACKKEHQPPTSNINLSKGLVAYYPFNSNTNDESGNNNNGTLLSGASLGSDLKGKDASALDCNGNGGHLLVNNNGKISFDSTLTISLDVMTRGFSRHTFLSMVDYNTGFGASFEVGTVAPKNGSVTFAVSNQDAPCGSFVSDDQSSGIITGLEIQPQSWYNVICSFNKGVLKTYINGQLITTSTSKDKVLRNCPNDELLIGGWWKLDPEATLDGKIDNVRLYDRELNSNEIEMLSKLM